MNRATKKFDKWDRERVIGAVQDHYGVNLAKIGKRDKWLRDESGRNWWVLGAVENWHGIPEEMMQGEKQAQFGGMLVIAERKLTSIEVFVGTLRQLVSSRDELSRTAAGDYQFTVEVRGDLMQCAQAPAVVLKRIDSISHSDEDWEQVRRISRFKRMVAQLSHDELIELLEKPGLDGVNLA